MARWCVNYCDYEKYPLLTCITAMGDPTASTIGLITASVFIAGFVAAPFASPLADRYGRRPALCLGSFLCVAGAAIQSGAQSKGMFIGGRVLIGLGISFTTNAGPSLLNELAHPRMRGRIASSVRSHPIPLCDMDSNACPVQCPLVPWSHRQRMAVLRHRSSVFQLVLAYSVTGSSSSSTASSHLDLLHAGVPSISVLSWKTRRSSSRPRSLPRKRVHERPARCISNGPDLRGAGSRGSEQTEDMARNPEAQGEPEAIRNLRGRRSAHSVERPGCHFVLLFTHPGLHRHHIDEPADWYQWRHADLEPHLLSGGCVSRRVDRKETSLARFLHRHDLCQRPFDDIFGSVCEDWIERRGLLHGRLPLPLQRRIQRCLQSAAILLYDGTSPLQHPHEGSRCTGCCQSGGVDGQSVCEPNCAGQYWILVLRLLSWHAVDRHRGDLLRISGDQRVYVRAVGEHL